MKIRHIWDQLSPATQKWLTDNPGCLVLPRTMTETICQETGVSAARDQHGQATISRADLDFIRGRADGTPGAERGRGLQRDQT